MNTNDPDICAKLFSNFEFSTLMIFSKEVLLIKKTEPYNAEFSSSSEFTIDTMSILLKLLIHNTPPNRFQHNTFSWNVENPGISPIVSTRNYTKCLLISPFDHLKIESLLKKTYPFLYVPSITFLLAADSLRSFHH